MKSQPQREPEFKTLINFSCQEQHAACHHDYKGHVHLPRFWALTPRQNMKCMGVSFFIQVTYEALSPLQIHSILALSHAYVTSIGRLVGVVTLSDVSLPAYAMLYTLIVAHPTAIHGKIKPQIDLLQEINTPIFDLQPPDEESAADLNITPPNMSVQ